MTASTAPIGSLCGRRFKLDRTVPPAQPPAQPPVRRSALELVPETPVAFVYNGSSFAVMMASPFDLADFAVGFTWTEAVPHHRVQTSDIDIAHRSLGIECSMTLPPGQHALLQARQRVMSAGSSCGLCGVRSLAEAIAIPPVVEGHALRLTRNDIDTSVVDIRDRQPLHDRTRAAHAAGFLLPGHGLHSVREDIGRHNALDKVAGAVLRDGVCPASGALVLTSRLSVEMVQKAAALGVPAMIAVSAPSALAVRLADMAGITLIGNARHGRHVIYTHPRRVTGADIGESGADHER